MHYVLTFSAQDSVERLLFTKQWLFFSNNDILSCRTEVIKKAYGIHKILSSADYILLISHGFLPMDIELLSLQKSQYLSLNFVYNEGLAFEIWGGKKWMAENLQSEAKIVTSRTIAKTKIITLNGEEYLVLKNDLNFFLETNG